MRVNRIILLIAIIRVVENQAAPYASGGSTCSDFKQKYLFVLTPAASENDLLTDLVKSAKSAIVKRPETERDPVQVLISPEDFTEFKKKSESLKIYKAHSLQCVDQTNFGIVETNTSRSVSAWTELNGKAKENSSIEITSPLAVKTTKEFHSKMCRTSDDCDTEFGIKMINVSLSNDVKKSLEATPGTISVDSSNSRISRASKTKKGSSKQKSKVKIATKFPIGKTRSKPKEQKKSAKKNDGMKSSKKVTKAEVAKKKTSLIPARRTSTRESWNQLMSLASKSLMKSNNTSRKSKPPKEVKSNSIAIRKLLSSAKVAKAKKLVNAKKKSSKQANKPKTNNTRKSAAKTSILAKKKTKSSNTRNRVNQQQKYRPKSQGGRKTSSAVNPKTSKKTVSKNRKPNRKSREVRIAAETGTNCSDYNTRKLSLGHLVKRNFAFRAPGACTIIKISTSCDGECLENDEIATETPNGQHGQNKKPKFPIISPDSSNPRDLFLPAVPPGASKHDRPNPPVDPSGGSGPPVIHPDNRIPLPALPIPPDYIFEVDPTKSESVGPYDYPEEEEADKELNDDLPTQNPPPQSPDEFPWFKPPHLIPTLESVTSTQRPYWVIQRPVTKENINPLPQEYSTMSPSPFGVPLVVPVISEEDVEDADNYDEDNEDDDDDEEEYDEEYEEEEEDIGIPSMSIPANLLDMIGEKYGHHVWNGKNIDDTEDSNGEDAYEDEDNYGKNEDDDENGDYEDDYGDDDEGYMEESGNAGIGDEDDYDSDED